MRGVKLLPLRSQEKIPSFRIAFGKVSYLCLRLPKTASIASLLRMVTDPTAGDSAFRH